MAIVQFLSAINKLDEYVCPVGYHRLLKKDQERRPCQVMISTTLSSPWISFGIISSRLRAVRYQLKKYPSWSDWRRSNGPTLVSRILSSLSVFRVVRSYVYVYSA